MSNNVNNYRLRKTTRGKPIPLQKMGYEDARLGRQFSPAITLLGEYEQKNYSNGRLWFFNLKAASLPTPPWSPTAKGLPDTLQKLANVAKIRIGSATRMDPMPEQSDLAFTRPHLDRRGSPLPVPTVCQR